MLTKFIHLYFVGLSFLTLFGFLNKYFFLADLCTHFRFQYFILQLLTIFFYIALKKWNWLVIAILTISINISQIAPFYFKNDVIKNNKKTIKLSLMNINAGNKNYHKIIQYINEENPDIFGLLELTPKAIKQLEKVTKEFKYTKYIPREDNFGIGLFSKIPIESFEIKNFTNISIPSILADCKLNNKNFSVLLTHTFPPLGSYGLNLRNTHLKNLAHFNFSNSNVIIMGDLNTTSWSYYFNKLKKNQNLKDTRKGFGIQATWPSYIPFMKIPLDHLLTSRKIKTVNRKTGYSIGSDHYPVTVEVIIPN